MGRSEDSYAAALIVSNLNLVVQFRGRALTFLNYKRMQMHSWELWAILEKSGLRRDVVCDDHARRHLGYNGPSREYGWPWGLPAVPLRTQSVGVNSH